MPKNRVTQSKLKHTAKTKITRKNKLHIGGGVPIAEQIQSVKHRDDFRSMFNNTFHVIYKTQTDPEPSKYEESVKELMRSMKRLRTGINTLIPITVDYMPLNKKTYKQSVTPLIGFIRVHCSANPIWGIFCGNIICRYHGLNHFANRPYILYFILFHGYHIIQCASSSS